MPAEDLAVLRAFRNDLHGCFPRRDDALFELVDALLTADPVASLPHLSLQAAHRRGLLRGQPLPDGPPVYAVDLSGWSRCDAEASPERGFYYPPSRHSAGQ